MVVHTGPIPAARLWGSWGQKPVDFTLVCERRQHPPKEPGEVVLPSIPPSPVPGVTLRPVPRVTLRPPIPGATLCPLSPVLLTILLTSGPLSLSSLIFLFTQSTSHDSSLFKRLSYTQRHSSLFRTGHTPWGNANTGSEGPETLTVTQEGWKSPRSCCL